MRKPKGKTVHRAHLVRGDGAVSALCFGEPRAIALGRATWTNRDDAVTCKWCIALLTALRESGADAPGDGPR